MTLLATFEQDEQGRWKVMAPLDGCEPASMQFTVEGTTVQFSEYVGVLYHSRIAPDILLYEQATVSDDE